MDQIISVVSLLAPAGLIAVSIASRHARTAPGTAIRAGQIATGLSLGIALLIGLVVVTSGSRTSPTLGIGDVGFSLRLDLLSATMFALVSFVGVLVVRYSRNYLKGDPRHDDFIGRLCLALAAVSLLVLAGNLAQLVVAWVGASFALHRLLVFYKDRPRAVIAGRKKMIAARAGDLCLLASVVLLAQGFGSADIATIAERAGTMSELPTGVGAAVWLLIAAAALKSAQFPFHAWLPEVMETPTPVSALLHAGMINSGGFLILRFANVVVLEPSAMTALLAVGIVTALVGSLVMLTQTSIKGTLAYSTQAQMGFMMIECGLGAFSVAMLHIVAHSLYKAHAFLSAGSAVLAKPKAAPPPVGRVAAALGIGVSGAAAIGLASLLVDPSSAAWSATVALFAVLAFGVAIWVGAQLRELQSPAALATAGAIALATPAVFLALKSGADLLYGAALPAMPAPSLWVNVLLCLGLAGFAGLAWLQLVGFPTSPPFQRLYVFARSGAYAGAGWDRWTGLRVRSTHVAGDRGSAEPATRVYSPGPAMLGETGAVPSAQTIAGAVERAAGAVPPLWPLSDFVAVNPFLGLTDQSFEEASAWLERSAGARTTMPRAYYADAIDRGDIEREDLVVAVQEAGGTVSLDAVERGARKCDRALTAAPTVADVGRGLSSTDVPRIVVEHIGDWAQTYFDRGQAKWPSPWRHLPPFAAWRAHASMDRAPEILGLADLRSTAAALPASPADAIAACVRTLGLREEELDLYFQRLLMRVNGWAGHLRYTGWASEIAGKAPSGIDELLAICLAWEVALHDADPRCANAWRIAKSDLSAAPAHDAERTIDLTLHRALEIATQRQLAERLPGTAAGEDGAPVDCQVAFCIDVRSERMRRALESCAPGVRTLGFAGFFGMAIEWIPLGEKQGAASCPVLLEPAHAVRETRPDAARLIARRGFRQAAMRAFEVFKGAAVSSFGFVETLGLAYGARLVADSTRRANLEQAPRAHEDGSTPDLAVGDLGGRTVGIALEQRIAMAEGALRGMSLTANLAPLVVLAAHGSNTVNNPYAAGLDCGACGGRSGEANARVAVAILNDPEVRSGLRARGIDVPDGTWFVAAVHDTTTDVVSICDRDAIPASHREPVAALAASLDHAGRLTRLERAPSLGIEDDDEAQVLARAVDWSQVRPEWGLAGCNAFIAAPRSHTAGSTLETSAFLHEYQWSQDGGFRVLEQIMTAPMVVATWINLQYFASTVDNRAFGAGDKVLHNIAGGLGVLEGNGGDVRVGLPMQSVHDGTRFVHRPCRLTAAVAAPLHAMTDIIARHPMVRALLDHGWIHLVALNDAGRISHRYVGDLQWTALCVDDADEVAA